MSFNLNWHTADLRQTAAPRQEGPTPRARPLAGVTSSGPTLERRRMLLVALLFPSLFLLPRPARANVEALSGLKRWGNGAFQRFGVLVYEATLWASDDPQRPPLALRIDYKRRIAGSVIASASLKEMRRFVADEARLQRWEQQMRQIFPDVKPGDHLLGIHDGEGVRFYQEDRLLGRIDDDAFADAFFAIWLDERTSAPELRAALLRPSEG